MTPARATLVGLGLLLLAGSSSPARAQQIGGINPIELFQQLDADGDMVIEKGEVPESGRPAFEQLLRDADKDKDGKIDREEYRDLLLSLRGAAPGPRPGMSGDRFRAMDKNGDGKVSKDEFQGPRPLFNRIDADKDGFITQSEGMRFQAALRSDRMKALDANGDGKISRDEFPGPSLVFDEVDANKDGFLSREETARLPAPGVPGPFFRRMDKDGNGKIERKEFNGPPAMFDRLDANKDGVLSLEEFRSQGPGPGSPPRERPAEAKKKDAKSSAKKAEK